MTTLTESAEDYLEAILIIDEKKKVVRIKDIAKHLNVKMPSVAVMINKLAKKNLVRHERYGYVELSEEGLQQAKLIYKRHKILFNFFHNFLGVDTSIAEEDACKIEHYLHPKTLKRMLKFLEFIETCPEEKPLWLSNFYTFLKTGKHPESCLGRRKSEMI